MVTDNEDVVNFTLQYKNVCFMFNFTDGINQVLGVKYTSRTRKWLPLIVYFSVTTETYTKDHARG